MNIAIASLFSFLYLRACSAVENQPESSFSSTTNLSYMINFNIKLPTLYTILKVKLTSNRGSSWQLNICSVVNSNNIDALLFTVRHLP